MPLANTAQFEIVQKRKGNEKTSIQNPNYKFGSVQSGIANAA
jgi:hypothetical protein